MPVSSTPDGSCLFHAISIALNGSEEFSIKLRLNTLIYLIKHFDQLSALTDPASLCSPSIMDTILMCRDKDGFSSHWTLVAVSNIISRPIDVLYPPIGYLNYYSKILTRLYYLHNLSKREPIYIMWTTLNINPPSGRWDLNHFCPLLSRSIVEKKSRFGTGIYAAEAFLLNPNIDNKGSEGVLSIIHHQLSEIETTKKIMANISISGLKKIDDEVIDGESISLNSDSDEKNCRIC